MLSHITSYAQFPNSHRSFTPFSCAVICTLSFDFNSRVRARSFKKAVLLTPDIGFNDLTAPWRSGRDFGASMWCGCIHSEGDAELEFEIMDFMENSGKPGMFPMKSELIQAGRLDLVEAIKTRGGWYTLGWDDNDGENVEDGVEESVGHFDLGELQRRIQHWKEKESASLREDCDDSSGFESLDSLQSASSSLDGSLESSTDEDVGIDGILSRLEKQRNSDFGLNIDGIGYKAHDEKEGKHFDTSLGVGGNGRPRHSVHSKVVGNAFGDKSGEQETWRTWSNQRAGTQYKDFEAAEISFGKNRVEAEGESYSDKIAVTTEENGNGLYEYEDLSHNQIRTRLQHLESELTSALHSLKSERVQYDVKEATESPNDLEKLSDAIEFQEDEFKSAKEKLRLIKAKLAVLEGKMALAVTDAQRLVEVKQKRMDDAHRALQLLRTLSIVWPNSASEVLLAGSFDGWTTKRKMEKSKTGIFSISLKLYPGKYEIKFIVDGVWKVDPLRPIINNNGYENNLLIVS